MVEARAAERFMAGSWLEEIDPKSRPAVLEAFREQRASAGSVLMAQGQANDHLGFLIEGDAAIERRRVDGRVETLATLTAPSVFGTTSFFSAAAPTFGVRAATDVGLLMLDRPAYDRLRREHPRAAEALAVAMIRVLSDRFNELDHTFSDYMARHPEFTEWAGFRARLFEEPSD